MSKVQSEETRRPSLLCVESNARARERLETILAECDCSFASNAAEAVREVGVRAFDAYVLDYFMPDWSGPLLCREIRKHDPHSPVILCTDSPNDGHSRTSLHAGASAYLAKPVDAEQLIAKLHTLLSFAASENRRATSYAQRAFDDELVRRGVMATTSEETARVLAQLGGTALSIERTARARAHQTFIESGGTRARFDRWWADGCKALFPAQAG